MVEVLVWLLVTTGSYGDSFVLERFSSLEQCAHVQSSLNRTSASRCIQANILVEKK